MSQIKKFDECLIHIGTEKTGSKTLQRWLWINRHRLLTDYGIFVPASLTPYSDIANHVRLSTISMSDDKFCELRIAAGVNDISSLHKHRMFIRQSFEDEVESIPEPSRRLVLSNEHLQSRLISDEEIERLRSFLSPLCSRFKIVVFLRPQFEVSLSAFSQALRAGRFDIDSLPNFREDNSGRHRWISRNFFDYENLLKRWERVFGYTQIYPRIWNEKQQTSYNVCEDFADCIGVDIATTVAPNRLNEAMSVDALQLLEWLNSAAPKLPSMTFRQRATIVQTLQRCIPGRAKIVSRTAIEAFQVQFDGCNDRVRHRWFNARPTLFDMDLSSFPQTIEEPSLTPLERAPLVLRLLIALVSDRDRGESDVTAEDQIQQRYRDTACASG